ncbi:glycosyltransferase, partial [Mesorhizobium japonicum]|uniref:glycosyltransferase n=1 Tax=Mesorhizobium japonicum TaxID=2066070 RepID=UPI003B5CB49E
SIFIGFVISGDKTCFIATKLARVKLIAAERNAPDMYWLRYSALHRHLSFFLLRLSDCIAIQFPKFSKRYPAVLRTRMIAIPNPVPRAVSFAQPGRESSSGRFTLLAVSRIDDKQKRISCIVHAFSLVAREFQNWDLLIVGDGPDADKISSLIRGYGLQKRIICQHSTKNIVSVYLRSNLFVISSLWEGFPNSLAEAMAHGLPAVGFSEAAGVSDLIDDSSGWLAPGLDDSNSLANTLRDAMADGSERISRGKQAIKIMLEFEPKVQFDCWESLLSKIISDKV